MKTFFGIVGILAGILLGLYVGVYLCFVGGLVDVIKEIIDGVNGDNMNAFTIVWGIVKIAFAGFAGWLSAVLLIFPSAALLGMEPTKTNRRRRR